MVFVWFDAKTTRFTVWTRKCIENVNEYENKKFLPKYYLRRIRIVYKKFNKNDFRPDFTLEVMKRERYKYKIGPEERIPFGTFFLLRP